MRSRTHVRARDVCPRSDIAKRRLEYALLHSVSQLRERRLTTLATVSMDKSESSFVNDGILDVVVIVCSKKIDDPSGTRREYKLGPLQSVM